MISDTIWLKETISHQVYPCRIQNRSSAIHDPKPGSTVLLGLRKMPECCGILLCLMKLYKSEGKYL